MNKKQPDWKKHLHDLDNHYHPDNFFADQKGQPTNESNVQDHYFTPALTEEMDLREEAQLLIDISQDDDNLYITSPLAGVNPNEIDINIEKDVLTIRGQRGHDHEKKTKEYLYQECYWGQFSRSVILPVPVIESKVEASFKDGVLTITMPKAEESKQVKIKVESK